MSSYLIYFVISCITAASILSLINIISFASAEPIIIVSTRNHFDKATGNLTSTEAYTPLDDGLLNSFCLDQEVVIYVHGVWVYAQKPSFPPIENLMKLLKD